MDIINFTQAEVEAIEQIRDKRPIKKGDAMYLKHLRYQKTKENEGYMCFCNMNEKKVYLKHFYNWYDSVRQIHNA
jgi:hypothetical protein